MSGKGEIGKAGQSLTVKQSSTTGIIDWKSFSVGAKDRITFDNGKGATLNRIVGGNLSVIAGSLRATGSVYLLNSAGVIVSGSGRIVTGGDFVASSGGLTNNAFDDGRRWFGTAAAKVVNRGSITAGGDVKLVGSAVSNTGTIAAPHVTFRATHGEALAGGIIDAGGDTRRGAHILVISDAGETKITGTLVAHNADGSGGVVETSGHRVAIGGRIDAGDGGAWLIDPTNLTVNASAATTIDNSLAKGTAVTLKTTKTGASGPGTTSSGVGDIIIASALSWSSSAQLTLDAYHSLRVNAPISVTGTGRLGLVYDDGGKGGGLLFDGGNVSFADTSDILGINRVQYELVADLKTLAADIAKDPSGDYALAGDYDATADGTYKQSPITTTFDGSFNGLGNVISGLHIDNSGSKPTGLFADVGSSGSIQDISLSAADVVGQTSVGMLAGQNEGLLAEDAASGAVNGTTYVGGLVGLNTGDVENDSSSVRIVDTHGTQRPGTTGSLVGGLVGYNQVGATITASFATGDIEAIDSSDVGGLTGRNSGTVNDSRSSSTVHGYNATGGLVGNNLGTVDQSWASGRVQGMRYVGGLIGISDNGLIEQSYAEGEVVADKLGKYQGGLIGLLGAKAQVENSYARGNVEGRNFAGGLVGMNEGRISSSYSTGRVSGANDIGGSIGEDDGTASDVYWDTGTSATKQGVGLLDAGATGAPMPKTSAALRKSLPSGFSSAIWALNAKINSGFPYLIALESSY